MTTAVLSFLVFLLSLSSFQHIQNCGAAWKKVNLTTLSCILCPHSSAHSELWCCLKKILIWPHHSSVLISTLTFNFTENSVQDKISHFKCIMRTAPSYFCDCLQITHPHYFLLCLRYSQLPDSSYIRLSTVGSHAFSIFSPSTWNYFLFSLWQKPSLDSSSPTLKHFFFFFPKQETLYVSPLMLLFFLHSLCLSL